MPIPLKYGVSAVAILAAVSFAHAQTSERQGGTAERGATRQEGNQGAAGAREKSAKQGITGERQPGENAKGNVESRGDRGAQTGRENTQDEKGAQTERQSQGHRTAKAGQNPESSEQGQSQENKTGIQGRENRQRQSNAAGAARGGNAGVSERSGERRVDFHVSGAQKTELHNIVIHDSGIHVYRRGDVHFAVNVGEPIPDSIEFYDPPARFVEVDPEFRGYKIVVLDTEILIVDPETREIVDIIEI